MKIAYSTSIVPRRSQSKLCYQIRSQHFSGNVANCHTL